MFQFKLCDKSLKDESEIKHLRKSGRCFQREATEGRKGRKVHRSVGKKNTDIARMILAKRNGRRMLIVKNLRRKCTRSESV